jgi:hypothetical protein
MHVHKERPLMKTRTGQWLTLAAIALALAGCGEGLKGFGGGSASQLEPINYSFVYSIETLERHVSISPEGEVEVWQQAGTDPRGRRAARGNLTPEQRAKLLAAFADWESVREVNEVSFRSPVIYITYGEKRVLAAGGESTPKAFKKAQALLDSIADSVLRTGSPATPPPMPVTPPA